MCVVDRDIFVKEDASFNSLVAGDTVKTERALRVRTLVTTYLDTKFLVVGEYCIVCNHLTAKAIEGAAHVRSTVLCGGTCSYDELNSVNLQQISGATVTFKPK